jgi:glucose-1-phosphate thymidylyltransferase
VIGLVPAAGRALRLGPLPCSKEIYPLGLRPTADGPRPRVVSEHLFDAFRRAGVDHALVLLRKGKWDIPAHLGVGRDLDLPLAYLALDATAHIPETLDAAYPFVADADIALGFPDTWFEPRDAYVHLLRRLRETGAEVVLGLVPSDRPEKTDMVELDEKGRVRRIVVKERDTGLRHAWMIAVWSPVFSRFLHDFVAGSGERRGELYPGHVVQAAVDAGMRVDGMVFDGGSFLDIGTPEDLARAMEALADGTRVGSPGE